MVFIPWRWFIFELVWSWSSMSCFLLKAWWWLTKNKIEMRTIFILDGWKYSIIEIGMSNQIPISIAFNFLKWNYPYYRSIFVHTWYQNLITFRTVWKLKKNTCKVDAQEPKWTIGVNDLPWYTKGIKLDGHFDWKWTFILSERPRWTFFLVWNKFF